jgi:hypothetical protein
MLHHKTDLCFAVPFSQYCMIPPDDSLSNRSHLSLTDRPQVEIADIEQKLVQSFKALFLGCDEEVVLEDGNHGEKGELG